MYLNCYVQVSVPTINTQPLLHAIWVTLYPKLTEIDILVDNIQFALPMSKNDLVIALKRGTNNVYFSLCFHINSAYCVACNASYDHEGELEYFEMQKPGSLQEICDYAIKKLNNVTQFATGL